MWDRWLLESREAELAMVWKESYIKESYVSSSMPIHFAECVCEFVFLSFMT